MKKFFVATAILLSTSIIVSSVSSCGITKGGNSLGSIQTISKVANVVSTAKQIANVLAPTLGLNTNQKSSITDIFSDYIGGTNNIASLANTNKKSYARKLLSLNKGTLGKINNVLTVAQYAKLLGLGGKNDSKSALLDGLVGGDSLSKSATNVLSGLLLNGIKG